MALSHFADKAQKPSEKDLARALGRAGALWKEVRAGVAARVPGLKAEWGWSGASFGWGLRLKAGTRVILYLTPREGSFFASLALGDKAVSSASPATLTPAVRRLLDAAPRYAEGRGVRLAVTTPADVRTVAALVSLKLAPAPRKPVRTPRRRRS
jgi:Protein of unknown function (DUF3788)